MSHSNQAALGTGNTSAFDEAAEKEAKLSGSKTASNDADSLDPADAVFDEMNRLSANQKVEELEKEMQAATFVASDVALQGQITIWFAGPNTGKTLLALKLVSEAWQENGGDLQIYHLNLDDDQRGIIDKANLGNRCGFNVLPADVLTDPLGHLNELVEKLIGANAAGRALLILDTTKKFTDVMNKGRSSSFMSLCRRFTAAGGTIIGLAHINKHADAKGCPIPAGTSDLRDDSDCAYVMEIAREESVDGGIRRFVRFENIKSRGAVAREATYSYEVNDEGDYPRMFYSVKQANAGEVAELKRQDQIKQEQQDDKELIEAIREQLSEQPSTQTALVESVKDQTRASKRQVLGCLERWSCAAEDGGLWVKSRGDNNAKIYTLHPNR